MTRQNKIPRGGKFLPNYGIPHLRDMCKRETEPKARRRILSWIKRKQGMTMKAISENIVIEIRTACNWLGRTIDDGVVSRYDIKNEGAKCRLNPGQLKQLVADLIAGPQRCGFESNLWSTKMVTEYIRRKFWVVHTARAVQYLLNRLGFTIQKQRPYKVRIGARTAYFKKKARRWARSYVKRGYVLLTIGKTHQHLNVRPGLG